MKYISVAKYTAVGISAGLLLTACASMDSDDEGSYTSYQSSYSSDYSGSPQQEASGSQTSVQASSTQSTQRSSSQASQAQMEGDQWVIPLHEEQVNVGKRSVESGQVTIRKVVTTETINQPIELRRETLVIDREGSSGNIATSSGTTSSSSTSASASASSEELSEPAGAQRSTTTQQSSSQFQSNAQGASSDSQPFQEQTFTIRLREEQPVVEKNVVQTGRVIARKNSEMERQTIQRQVRREDVQVDRSGTAANVQSNIEAAGAQPVQQQEPTRVEHESTVIESSEIESGRDKNTLDEINEGNNTRGGAEDLQDFDEKAPK